VRFIRTPRGAAADCRALHVAGRASARDFWEALQSVWFLFVLLQMESNASSFSPAASTSNAAVLEADLAAGTLTMNEAQELLESLWLKFNEIVLLRSSASARYFAGFPIGFNVILGGQLHGERDATNFLSYMCLRAQADLGLTQPNLSIRVHERSPQEFLLAAAGVIAKGSGMPQVFKRRGDCAGPDRPRSRSRGCLELCGGRLRGALDAGKALVGAMPPCST